MLRPRRLLSSLIPVILLAGLVGCAGNGNDVDEPKRRPEKEAIPVTGSFVGKIPGRQALVAVVVSPPEGKKDRRDLKIYICGGKPVCEWFRGKVSGQEFALSSADDDAEATGELSKDGVTGTIELPKDETLRFVADSATATAGLYELTVSREGKIRGASATGVALKGKAELPRAERGELKLADGSRLKFDVVTDRGDAPVPLGPGQLRVIVLADGQLKGVGQSRGGKGRDKESVFFIHSRRSR
jgi:hypothetical protein